MSNSITDKEAAQTLAQVKSTQAEINRRSAKEYAPWIGWGLYVIVSFSGFDYIKPAIWGPICWIAALIGTYITYSYFRKRHTQIKTTTKVPWYAWLLYGLWIAIGVAFANAMQPHFAYAWTVAGLAVGVPYILYGLKLKSQG